MIYVLFFTPGDFEDVLLKKLTSTVILSPLAQSNDVKFKIYVINRPIDIFVEALKGFKRFRKYILNRNIISKKISIFTPFVLLNEVIHESLCSWGNINMKIFIWQVKKLIKREDLKTDKLILWSHSPFHWKVMKEIPAKRKFYEVYDEYGINTKTNKLQKNIYNAEKKMILFSDEIICSSEKLQDKFHAIVPRLKKTHLISTSANDGLFIEGHIKNYSPWDVIPGPKGVILGAIRQQTDLDLIEKISTEIPKMSIVFIGRNQEYKFKRILMSYQNIYHLGFLPWDYISYCICSATIGLYPARRGSFSLFANPRRIYDYAAAGIPIVANNINCESDFPKSLIITNSDTDFIASLKNLLKDGISIDDKKELIEFARRHSIKENTNKYLKIFQSAMS